jgi:WD40 repeat protein
MYNARFSRDGGRIVTAHVAARAYVWSAADGRLIATIQDASNTMDAAFSPDGSSIVTIDDAGYFRMWNAANGQLISQFGEGMRYLTGVEFSADGAQIITTQIYAGAKIWSTTQKRVIAAFAKACEPQDAAFSPDRQRIVLACNDGTAQVWRPVP